MGGAALTTNSFDVETPTITFSSVPGTPSSPQSKAASFRIGEFPRFDFFFNAKIQQTRVFIKVEHLNSSFTGYDYYSDPFNPYRDMSVRLGLVWNFFS